MPNVKLDKEKIQQLLRQADERWYTQHSGSYNYQEHLGFTADYISKRYRPPELGRKVKAHA
ncbi:unnamed protein product [marine sediment metagenome]|uniref:Uncharacterized protein n=1 Tax=marine sediment metagenome TaxID=412755 RepID=X1RU56_9ZZZZ